MATTTIFKNIRVFDGEEVHPSATVVVKNGKISSISTSPSSDVEEESATVIDKAGHTLLPGLIESHMHAHLPPGKGPEILKPAIACGITTCMDMHNSPESVILCKNACNASAELPDLKSAFYGAMIAGGWPKPIVLHLDPSPENYKNVMENWPSVTPDTAEEFVRSNIALGADYIKLMQENGAAMKFEGIPVASLELQTALTKATHAHGLLALAHATSLDETLLVLRAGVDALMHAFTDLAPTPELTEAYKKNDAFLVPTLVVAASLTGEEQELRERFAAKATERQLLPDVKENMCRCLGLGVPGATIKNAYETVKQLKAAGIDIVAGTDAVPQLSGTAIGPSFVQELYMYVERCGFTPTEALRSATSVPARRFKFLGDRGRIAEGLRADLLLVKGDPSTDIEDLCNVVGVWKAGEVGVKP